MTEAIIMTSPSNRTRFAVFATATLPDLNSTDGGSRAVTKKTR